MEHDPTIRAKSTVLGSYGIAWQKLKSQPGVLFLILLVFAVLQLPPNLDLGSTASAIMSLYQILVIGPMSFGFSWVLLVAVRDKEPQLGDLFALFQNNYWSAIGATLLLPIVILISALPAIGALLLVTLQEDSDLLLLLASAFLAIPLFTVVRLGFVPYLLAERRLGPVEVLGESWTRTEPLQLQILGVSLLALPLLVMGLLLLVVGILPAFLVCGLAHAVLYDQSPAEPASEENDDLSSDAS